MCTDSPYRYTIGIGDPFGYNTGVCHESAILIAHEMRCLSILIINIYIQTILLYLKYLLSQLKYVIQLVSIESIKLKTYPLLLHVSIRNLGQGQ